MLHGLNIVVQPDMPRRVLPDVVTPGVPWPPGFKEQFDAWALDYFGTTNLIADDTVLDFKLLGHLRMNPRTYARLRAAASIGEKK